MLRQAAGSKLELFLRIDTENGGIGWCELSGRRNLLIISVHC
jgi:hypothetical protein